MVKSLRTVLIFTVLISFIGTAIQMPAHAQIDPMPFMPAPGTMAPLSPEFTPAYLKGIVIHPNDPFKFDFIIYKGDKSLTYAQKKEEYTKLTKYFLASLAIPDDDQWVNLSPYEKDRIIKDDFGKTEMGRDLLAQDYLLKQITASLICPESQIGREFWKKVYAQAQKQYGTTDIPVNTFNKVWILPDDALIYEKGNAAYVLKNHLRVMLEEDYLALQKHSAITHMSSQNVFIGDPGLPDRGFLTKAFGNDKVHTIASQIIRQIVLPELQKEVNQDANFAPLRQVCSGMLLATWFKRTLKQSLLCQIYANKAKVRGADQDPKTNEEIDQQYLKAYKKGVFNFIKEDTGRLTNETMPRKYFSGGLSNDFAQVTRVTTRLDSVEATKLLANRSKFDLAQIAAVEHRVDPGSSHDAAMRAELRKKMMRGSRLERVEELLRTGQRFTPPQLAQAAGIRENTLYQDMKDPNFVARLKRYPNFVSRATDQDIQEDVQDLLEQLDRAPSTYKELSFETGIAAARIKRYREDGMLVNAKHPIVGIQGAPELEERFSNYYLAIKEALRMAGGHPDLRRIAEKLEIGLGTLVSMINRFPELKQEMMDNAAIKAGVGAKENAAMNSPERGMYLQLSETAYIPSWIAVRITKDLISFWPPDLKKIAEAARMMGDIIPDKNGRLSIPNMNKNLLDQVGLILQWERPFRYDLDIIKVFRIMVARLDKTVYYQNSLFLPDKDNIVWVRILEAGNFSESKNGILSIRKFTGPYNVRSVFNGNTYEVI